MRTYDVDILGGVLSIRWATAASVRPGLAPVESRRGGFQGFLELQLGSDAGVASQNSNVVQSLVLNCGSFGHQLTSIVMVVGALLTDPNNVLKFI
jgi:hypothetical protein